MLTKLTTPTLILALGIGVFETAATAQGGTTIALLSVQDRAANTAVAQALDIALRFELSKSGSLIGPDQTRDTLRRMRIRNGDQTAPERLRELGQVLGADLLVTATLHDVTIDQAPQLTASAMLYSSTTGELLSGAFEGRSGADGHQILGLGYVGEIDKLVPVTAANLIEELMTTTTTGTGSPTATRGSLAGLGVIGVVPFDGIIEVNATLAANTLTRAVEVTLLRHGARMLSPNRTHEIVRQIQVGKWGSIASDTRDTLHSQGNADVLLTGTIEWYELGTRGGLANPRVGFAMRLLDASTGRIVWTGDIERRGSSRGELFRIGRVYSKGALATKLLDRLFNDLAKEAPRLTSTLGDNG